MSASLPTIGTLESLPALERGDLLGSDDRER